MKDIVRSMHGMSTDLLSALEGQRMGRGVTDAFLHQARDQMAMFADVLSGKAGGGPGGGPGAGGGGGGGGGPGGLPPLHRQGPQGGVGAGVGIGGGGQLGGEPSGGVGGVGGVGGAAAPPPVLAPLNYAAVRKDLVDLSKPLAESKESTGDSGGEGKESSGQVSGQDAARARRCCRLLQALRWRLTRSHAGAPRKRVLHAYIQNDLIGTGGGGGPSVATDLLRSTGGQPLVVEYACRFINCVASECDGRTYLLSQPDLVGSLVQVLKSEETDTLARQNALGALQKFSLRRRAQTMMIEEGLIRWICDTLRGHYSSGADGEKTRPLSEYTIEYATALLMNLSLRTLGKTKAEDPEVKILEVLNEFVESDNTQVRTYVNGTLYSVLTRPVLKEQAMAMGMDEMLRRLMGHSQEQFRKQIEYILEQLSAPPAASDGAEADGAASDEEDDEDVEGDDEEDEDADDDEEVDETLPPPDTSAGAAPAAAAAADGESRYPDTRSGEELLCSFYLAQGGDSEAAQEEVAMVAESLRKKSDEAEQRRASQSAAPPAPAAADAMPLRPVTPRVTGTTPRVAADAEALAATGGSGGGGGGDAGGTASSDPLDRTGPALPDELR